MNTIEYSKVSSLKHLSATLAAALLILAPALTADGRLHAQSLSSPSTSSDAGGGATTSSAAYIAATSGEIGLPALTLPEPMMSQDIGKPRAAGSAAYTGESYSVWGAGGGIGADRDQFHYVYRAITGDVDIRVRVASIEQVHRWSKGGVMIRESLNARSRFAMALTSAAMGYAFQRRVDTAGYSELTTGGTGAAPGWVRLVRTGDAFEAFRSADGEVWTSMGRDAIPMSETVYVGLAVSSNRSSELVEAVFDNLEIATTDSSPNEPPVISLTSPLDGTTATALETITLTAAASDSDGTVARVEFVAGNATIGSDDTAPYSIDWSAVPAGTYTLSAIAYDDEGASTRSSTVSLTVLLPPMTIILTSPSAGASFVAPAAMTLTAVASGADARISKVEFFANGILVGADVASPWAVELAKVAAGTYALTAVVHDAQTGAVSTSAAVNVTVTVPPAPVPRIAVFVASDDHATVTRYVLEVFAAGANPATATAITKSDLGKPAVDANNEIRVDQKALFDALARGEYVATVRAHNNSGFTRSAPATFVR